MQYPYCEAANLFYTRGDSVYFSEKKFFESLSYADFLDYELMSSYPKIKIEEIEKYLESKQ